MRRKGIGLPSNQETALPCCLFWAKKGGFAVLDHGLFAGANFLVNILLAGYPLKTGQLGVGQVR